MSLGAAIAAELMIGFWFSIRVMLAIGVADDLNHFDGALMSGKSAMAYCTGTLKPNTQSLFTPNILSMAATALSFPHLSSKVSLEAFPGPCSTVSHLK